MPRCSLVPEKFLLPYQAFFNFFPWIESPVVRLMLFASKTFPSEENREYLLRDICCTQPLQAEQRELQIEEPAS